MRHHHLLSSTTTTTAAAAAATAMSPPKPNSIAAATHLNYNKKKFSSNPNPNFSNHSSSIHNCQNSPANFGDIIILILVLFSGTFLISSYFSYILRSMSLLLHIISPSFYALDFSSYLYYIAFSLFFFAAIISFWLCVGFQSRKCRKLGCKGLKKAMEFDLQLQTEECLKSGSKGVKEVDHLPWKGGKEGNPDYESVLAELRKMAPPNGRAVLLFRAKCGCPFAKLEGWSLKRGRKHKKSIVFNGDHR